MALGGESMITEYELYSDERRVSFSGRRYLFVGGVVCTQTGRDRLLYSLSQVRSSYHLLHEMKWEKVSRRYLKAYKSWVDVFFDDPFSRFSVLWLELSSPDWQSFTPRPDRRASKDDRLASVFYQFLLVTFGPLRDMKRWWVYPDAGLFSRDTVLSRVEFLFNRTYKGAFGPKSSRIIRLARSRDSRRTDLIQLADVLLGALTFRILGSEPDSPAKRHLARYCSARLDREPRTRRGLERLMVRKWQPPARFKYSYGETPSNNGM
jgi:hypothetical protein